MIKGCLQWMHAVCVEGDTRVCDTFCTGNIDVINHHQVQPYNLRCYTFEECNRNRTLILACRNTDDGHVSKYGNSCNKYKKNWCGGDGDTNDFQANSMCCICGGGTTGKLDVKYY